MEFNESMIRQIIARVIKEFEEPTSQKLYVVVTETLKFPLSLFEQLYMQQTYDIVILLPECLSQENLIQIFPEKANFKFVLQSRMTELPTGKFESLFPMFDKTSMAKVALGISDSFATRWIEHCFEHGQEINLLKSGMQVLTGKEPLAYRKTFENYIKTLSDYEIKVIDEIPDLYLSKSEIKDEVQVEEKKKKVITYQDVFNYQENKEITIERQDIITDLAKEKARDLGIVINSR